MGSDVEGWLGIHHTLSQEKKVFQKNKVITYNAHGVVESTFELVSLSFCKHFWGTYFCLNPCKSYCSSSHHCTSFLTANGREVQSLSLSIAMTFNEKRTCFSILPTQGKFVIKSIEF